MAKRKSTKQNKKATDSSRAKKLIILLSLATIAPLLGFLYFYHMGYIELHFDKKTKEHKQKQEPIADKDLIRKIETILAKSEEQSKKIKIKLEKVISANKEQNTTEKPMFPTITDALNDQKPTEVEDYLQNNKTDVHKSKKTIQKTKYKGLPRVAIVIDDVSFGAQVKKIKKIPYKVTPSFLPPTNRHPDTPKLAKKFSYYMVHLPLEALHHSHPESRTLKKGESYKSIHGWIRQIKKDFPRAKFYNNHTGSKFTADYTSMDRLYKVFKKENLLFLDSKTTSKSKANMMAKKYKLPTLYRDIFLDNSYKEASIKKQLLETIRIAKLRGYAIAICHPHTATLKVLRQSKSLLKGVKTVYINEIPRK